MHKADWLQDQLHTELRSYPRHLSEVCVHVLVTDWNHLPDAPVVTVENTVKMNSIISAQMHHPR